ncbi:hypothetical protein CRG98_007842 [Punica granatum]|uniref:Uncharacterized protein n=1 Tax=Punica granatum TaxID=22663 RepID=A0A2I0KTB0_PUNGR|nr:hypothetical protein CRG98_007842 [Punica granatum]
MRSQMQIRSAELDRLIPLDWDLFQSTEFKPCLHVVSPNCKLEAPSSDSGIRNSSSNSRVPTPFTSSPLILTSSTRPVGRPQPRAAIDSACGCLCHRAPPVLLLCCRRSSVSSPCALPRLIAIQLLLYKRSFKLGTGQDEPLLSATSAASPSVASAGVAAPLSAAPLIAVAAPPPAAAAASRSTATAAVSFLPRLLWLRLLGRFQVVEPTS